MLDKVIELKKIRGLRNDADLERFELGDLSVAQNVDIDSSSRISRRRGYTKLASGSVHSVWSDGRQALCVRDSTLHRIEADLTLTDLYWYFRGNKVTYASIGETVYMSDKYMTATVRPDRRVRQWGLCPAEFSEARSIPGSLPAGVYQYAMTFVRDDGYEGPATKAKAIALGSYSGLRWDLLPDDGVASYINIYLSSANGEILYIVGKYKPGSMAVEITNVNHSGPRLRTQFTNKPPPGRVFGPWNGRIFIASGNFVSFTVPFEYELVEPHKDWWAFDSEVQTMAFLKGGVFVGTRTKTYFLSGSDPNTMDVKEVLGYGSIVGSEVPIRSDLAGDGLQGIEGYIWMSPKGMCLGTSSGSVTNVTGERYAPSEALYGAGILIEDNGLPQYRVNLFDDDPYPYQDEGNIEGGFAQETFRE
jgi:hypothetical protein